MPKLVTSGAIVQCSLGSVPGQLQIGAGAVTAGNAPVATTATVNFSPFGVCNAMNPPMQCAPAPAGPWAPGSSTVRAGATPVLNDQGQCRCQRGGVITIVGPGQQTTTVADAGPVFGPAARAVNG